MIFKVHLNLPLQSTYCLTTNTNVGEGEGGPYSQVPNGREETTPQRDAGWCLQGMSLCLGDCISKICLLFF